MSSLVDNFEFTEENLSNSDFLDKFVQCYAPGFLLKPGMNLEKQDQLESDKKKLLSYLMNQPAQSTDQSSKRLNSLKSLIDKMPKDKQMIMIYMLCVIGIWDGLEDQMGEEVYPAMTGNEISDFFYWIDQLSIEKDQDIFEQVQLEVAHATAIIHHASIDDTVTDVKGFIIYHDSDFVILHSDEGQILAIDRVAIDDVGLFRGAYVYAQKELEGELKGKFKLIEPGIVLER